MPLIAAVSAGEPLKRGALNTPRLIAPKIGTERDYISILHYKKILIQARRFSQFFGPISLAEVIQPGPQNLGYSPKI